MNRHNEILLEEYRRSCTTYENLKDTAVRLLQDELKQSGIMVLQLSHRLKTEDSLRGKLERKGDRYQSITDITDLLGIRIICYFADDVDRIAERIEGLFVIDRKNSVDKRKILDDDRFGYMSLHYICTLAPEQCSEASLCTIPFEIQIRTVLQHAWAEINHDIGYKSSAGVPHSITREFSRIAGLLEIADIQFTQIRDNMQQYKEESAETVREQKFEDLPVNETTLSAYFENDPAVNTFFREQSTVLLIDECDGCPERLSALNIAAMDQFAALVNKYLGKALELAEYENDGKNTEITSGQLIRLLIEACLIQSQDPESDIHDYMIRYYGETKTAEQREKDLLKYIKRMKKGKKAKKEGSSIL